MLRRLASVVPISIAMLVVSVLAGPVHASDHGPGTLDPDFSEDGKVTIDATEDNATDFANGVTIQPNGKIVVTGEAIVGSVSNIGLARFGADGVPDASFGEGDGTVHALFGSASSGVAVVRSGSRILVGGSLDDDDWVIAAFDNHGDSDTTFNGDGFITSGMTDVSLTALALQPDGKILAGGYSMVDGGDFLAWRFTSDGEPDTSFSSDGVAKTDFGDTDAGQALVIQANGKIVQGGTTQPTTGDDRFALVRYLSDGKRDTSYGSGGRVTTSIGAFDDDLLALARQSDGKIVAAGESFRSGIEEEDFALVRYNTDGSEDQSFGGGDGEVVTMFTGAFSIARGVAVQSSGKIVAVGVAFQNVEGANFALARYKPDGSLNGSFGSGGLVSTDFGQGSTDDGAAVALQTDGKIVVVGSRETSEVDFAVARYLSA